MEDVLLTKRCLRMHLTLFILSVTVITLSDGGIPDATYVSYEQEGDYKIGGIFPLSNVGEVPCGLLPTLSAIQLTEAMVYAVNVVNNDTTLLPNVTLGFDIRDSCLTNEDAALWAALTLANSNQCGNFDMEKKVKSPGRVIGFIGPYTSSQSIVVSTISDLLEVPSIAYAASSDELSDKFRFEFFSRAIPPDSHQTEALADLLQYFNWKYVSLVYYSNSYGIRAAHAFQNFATKRDICIALSAPVRDIQTQQELTQLADALFDKRRARVVVMFVSSGTAKVIIATLQTIYAEFASEITWIGSDYWGHTIAPLTDEILPIGGIFVQFFNPTPVDFKTYFTNLSPETSKRNPWLNTYFVTNDDFTSVETYDSTGLGGLASSVIDSVFAFAHALDSLLKHSCPDVSRCPARLNITGRQLLQSIRNTSFEGTRGQFKLDSNGDSNGKYVLKNLQMLYTGEAALVDISVWDALNTSQKLTIYPEKIKWFNGTGGKAPRSICKEDCQAGYIVVPLKEKCCWGCRKCRNNEIALNQSECKVCEITEWPNEDFTICKPIEPSLLDMKHPILVLIILFSCLGEALCALITVGLVKYYNHPQVKASSRELSAFNIIGLQLGFLTIILLLLKPSTTACIIVHGVISLSFTLIYAPTLLKVSRIYRIFDAGKKSTQRPRWTGPKDQLILSTIFLTFQVTKSTYHYFHFDTPSLNFVVLAVVVFVVVVVSEEGYVYPAR